MSLSPIWEQVPTTTGVAAAGAVALTLVLLLSINRRRKKAREAEDAREPVEAGSPRSARPTASTPGVGVSASLATAMAQTAATTAPATIVEGQRVEDWAADGPDAGHTDTHDRVNPFVTSEIPDELTAADGAEITPGIPFWPVDAEDSSPAHEPLVDDATATGVGPAAPELAEADGPDEGTERVEAPAPSPADVREDGGDDEADDQERWILGYEPSGAVHQAAGASGEAREEATSAVIGEDPGSPPADDGSASGSGGEESTTDGSPPVTELLDIEWPTLSFEPSTAPETGTKRTTSFAQEPAVDPVAAWALVDGSVAETASDAVVDPERVWAELERTAQAGDRESSPTTAAAAPAQDDARAHGEHVGQATDLDGDAETPAPETDVWGSETVWGLIEAAATPASAIDAEDGPLAARGPHADHLDDPFDDPFEDPLEERAPWRDDADGRHREGLLGVRSAGNGRIDAPPDAPQGPAQAVLDPPVAAEETIGAPIRPSGEDPWDMPDLLAVFGPEPERNAPEAPSVDGEPATEDEPATDRQLSGRFTLSGVAARAGDRAICAIALPHEAATPPDPAEITLVFEGVMNCRTDDARVMTEPGFAPTSAGFTIMGTATAPGPFLLNGTYRMGRLRGP